MTIVICIGVYMHEHNRRVIMGRGELDRWWADSGALSLSPPAAGPGSLKFCRLWHGSSKYCSDITSATPFLN